MGELGALPGHQLKKVLMASTHKRATRKSKAGQHKGVEPRADAQSCSVSTKYPKTESAVSMLVWLFRPVVKEPAHGKDQHERTAEYL